MSYFERFPLANYNGVYQIDLTQATTVDNSDRRNHIETDVMDGESPELLADRMYDDADMAWVILMYNKMINVFEDWPMSSVSLKNYVTSKYDDPNAIHHYISASTGLTVDSSHPDYDRIPVTNLEHENNVNESKRNIKIPLPEVADRIKRQHNELIDG